PAPPSAPVAPSVAPKKDFGYRSILSLLSRHKDKGIFFVNAMCSRSNPLKQNDYQMCSTLIIFELRQKNNSLLFVHWRVDLRQLVTRESMPKPKKSTKKRLNLLPVFIVTFRRKSKLPKLIGPIKNGLPRLILGCASLIM